MFVRLFPSVPVPRVPGLIIALNVRNKEYFMLRTSSIDRLLSKLKNSVDKSSDDPRCHVVFRNYARRTEANEWEFYYSTDPSARVPSEFHSLFKLLLTGTKSDAVVAMTDSKIYKVTHNFTDIPVYVADKCTAAKMSILRKVVKQLDKFMNQHGADFSKAVEKNYEKVSKAYDIYSSTFNMTNYCLRDVTIEPMAHDESFATLAARGRHLNLEMLRTLK